MLPLNISLELLFGRLNNFLVFSYEFISFSEYSQDMESQLENGGSMLTAYLSIEVFSSNFLE